MKRVLRERIAEVRHHWRHYVLQSLAAGLTVFLAILFMTFQNQIIIASLGATAFIVFAMPNSVTAQPRRVVGGHAVGVLAGFCCSLLPHATQLGATVVYACAVAVSMFLMVASDTEHPPAAGTALGIASSAHTWQNDLGVLIGAIVLTVVQRILHPRLRDLT
ncbi:HPP family protein [bacterium]|nr:HPP family protein [bacterium]